MRTNTQLLVLITGLLVTGCASAKEGTSAAAKGYLQSEINLWLAGQPSRAETFRAKIMSHEPPTDFEIQSILPTEPDMFARDPISGIPENYKEFPAYLVNVKYVFRSMASTPINKIMVYRLTWNTNEKTWYLREQ